MKTDKNRPVSSIKHNDKRAAIPDSAHQGEEEMALIRFRLSFLHISLQPSALSPPSPSLIHHQSLWHPNS